MNNIKKSSNKRMRVLVTANMSDESLDRLRNDLGFEVDYHPRSVRKDKYSLDKTAELLKNTEIFIVGYEGVSGQLMDQADDLEVIASSRGGPEANIDIGAATERGIPVLYSPGRNAVSVADFTIGLMISVSRHIAYAHQLLHTGTYTGEPSGDAVTHGEREDVTWGAGKNSPYVHLKGPELNEKCLAIIGMGDIGKRVAQRAKGFGMDIRGYDPFVDTETMAEYGVTKIDDLHSLLPSADFITLHVPVNDHTRGLIGPDEFELMHTEAYFINTARGALIDQDALLKQLDQGTIGGAALDVYDDEPLPDSHPLLDHPNVVTTPHLGGAAYEVIDRHSKMVVDGIAALYSGDQPDHIANQEVLKTS
jgi:D-3-phosphoglycerate dehydrogenase